MKALINIIIANGYIGYILSRQHSLQASKTEFRAGAMEDKVEKCTSNTWECHFYKTNTPQIRGNANSIKQIRLGTQSIQ